MKFNTNFDKLNIITLKISNDIYFKELIYNGKISYCLIFYNRTKISPFDINKILIIPNNILKKNIININKTSISLNIKNIITIYKNNILYKDYK